MKILFYRYGSICEPDIIQAFKQLDLIVIEETTEITNKKLSSLERLQLVERTLQKENPLFVFSINFYPVIAEICSIYQTLYLCWTVDSPVPELFSKSILKPTNRIFLFDRAQHQYFSPYNPEHIYYLPLASSTERFDKIVQSITKQDRINFGTDISFVGSLYNEKNPMHNLQGLSEYAKGFIDGLVESSLKVYGYNPVEDAMTLELASIIKAADPTFYTPKEAVTNSDCYIAAHSYIGMQIAETERIRTLNTLAKFFPVDLFTLSDTSALSAMPQEQRVRIHGGVASLTEMPKIFHLSKINLNMTIKPIQTGLPLRIFDILGCGGFLMTNYQAELPEYFDIGVDLEAYSSMEELIDKCAYYLEHDEERQQIARNGYEKVCAMHTYPHRIREMLRFIS